MPLREYACEQCDSVVEVIEGNYGHQEKVRCVQCSPSCRSCDQVYMQRVEISAPAKAQGGDTPPFHGATS